MNNFFISAISAFVLLPLTSYCFADDRDSGPTEVHVRDSDRVAPTISQPPPLRREAIYEGTDDEVDPAANLHPLPPDWHMPPPDQAERHDGEYTWKDDAKAPATVRPVTVQHTNDYYNSDQDYTGMGRRSQPPRENSYVYIRRTHSDNDEAPPWLRQREADQDFPSESRQAGGGGHWAEQGNNQWDLDHKDEDRRRGAAKADQVYGEEDDRDYGHEGIRVYGPPNQLRESGRIVLVPPGKAEDSKMPVLVPALSDGAVKSMDQASVSPAKGEAKFKAPQPLSDKLGADQFPSGTQFVFNKKPALNKNSNCSDNQDIQTLHGKGSCLTCWDSSAKEDPKAETAYNLDSGSWSPESKPLVYNLKGQPGVTVKCSNLSGKETLPEMVKALEGYGLKFSFANHPEDRPVAASAAESPAAATPEGLPLNPPHVAQRPSEVGE